ncbi:MAG: carboxypeptidase Y-deficient [Phylliscum demangeonii]|nr:MAG: carboxypeptidase Y-deficient [Phylliscum demangeonii]
MSRTLGGGRILGSGRSLSAATIVPDRHSSLLSLSESTLSVNSDDQDLSSRVSFENGEALPAEEASTKLACPICNEDMLTLLQLNRHLDDNHQNLEAVEQDEVKTWFKKQMVKAKKFQPLAALNQKLKGLDVFEANDAPHPTGSSPNATAVAEVSAPDPDQVVTRAHWQRPRSTDMCSEPMCGKHLGASNGSINCRKCGKLFCEEHTMYQMKLSRSAQHEPVRGIWCRACETCYKSREGYNDHHGRTQDHSELFVGLRRKMVDKRYLEIVRLEKRLSKLTQALVDPSLEQGSGVGGLRWPLTGQRNPRKAVEQSVVAWEDDGAASTAANALSEKTLTEVHVDVRMCQDCRHSLFSRRDFEEEVARKGPSSHLYETLVQFEKGIRTMLPRFQRLLAALQDPDQAPSSAQLSEASKVRKRLLDAFTQYDVAARRMRDLPSTSSTQKKVQAAIFQEATLFLHRHMLPLKSLPRILRHASPNAFANGHPTTHPRSTPVRALASIRYKERGGPGEASSQGGGSSTTTSALDALEAEEKQLRERLIVLEEQKFLVGEMLAAARAGRRFDEITALTQNIHDLDREIDQVNGMLSQLDFATAYEQTPPASLPGAVATSTYASPSPSLRPLVGSVGSSASSALSSLRPAPSTASSTASFFLGR